MQLNSKKLIIILHFSGTMLAQSEELISSLNRLANTLQAMDAVLGGVPIPEDTVTPPPPPPPGPVPPPPPPAPKPVPTPTGSIALSSSEIEKLSLNQKEESDKALADFVRKLGDIYAIDVNEINSLISNAVSALKKNAQFRYRSDHNLDQLKERIIAFVQEGLLIEIGKIKEIETGSLQSAEISKKKDEIITEQIELIAAEADNTNTLDEFIEIFNPWVLADFKKFKSTIFADVQGFFINIASAVRKQSSIIDISSIDVDSSEANESDDQFQFAVERSENYSNFLEQLNRLRANVRFLKWAELESDFIQAKKRTSSKQESEDEKKALERAIRERGQRSEGQTTKESIFSVINKVVEPVLFITTVDWGRYLFLPKVIQEYPTLKTDLLKIFKSKKEEKKEPVIVVPTREIPFEDYFETVVMKSKDITDVMQTFIEINLVKKALETGKWSKTITQENKRSTVFIVFDPVKMSKFIKILAPERFSKNTTSSIAQKKQALNLVMNEKNIFGRDLSPAVIDKLNEFEKTLSDTAGVSKEIEKFVNTIQGDLAEISLLEKIYYTVQFYQFLDEKIKDERYAKSRNTLLALRDELVSTERTVKDVKDRVLQLIANATKEIQTKTLGKMNFITPYGSLTKLINYYVKLMDQVKRSNDLKGVYETYSKLVELLTELNTNSLISDGELQKELPIGIRVQENYREKLDKVIQALKDGQVNTAVEELRNSFFYAGIKVAQEARNQEAADKFEQNLSSFAQAAKPALLAKIVLEFEPYKKGDRDFPGLSRDSRDARAKFSPVYVAFKKVIDSLGNQILEIIKTTMSDSNIQSLEIEVQQFAKNWQHEVDVLVRGKEYSKDDMDTIHKAINDFADAIKERLNNLKDNK